MKYRDHSLRYIPRDNAPKPEPRQAQPRPEEPVKELEPDAHFKSLRHDEPLFHVDDKTSRIDNLKETIGGIHHATKDILVPHAKKHTKRFYSKTKPLVAKHSKKTLTVLHTTSKKLPLSKTRLIQIVAVIVIFAGGYTLAHRTTSTEKPGTTTKIGSDQQPVGGTKPSYNTILPKGKNINDFGGWSRVSPPTSNPVFAYVDTLERVQISVSEQPMPENFSNNPDEDVKDLALNFNAKERVVADDATIYFIGTSTKGPQSIIFTKKGVLILIKSPVQIKNEAWSKYIAELQ
jgi:hypothetical protein